MNSHKVLNALSYFSIFFAPILLPVFIWILGNDKEVKHHAKVALLTHILPFIGFIFAGLATVLFSVSTNSSHTASFVAFGLIIVVMIMSIVLVIFNIVRGIQMFARDDADGCF